jgi:hypothetical protein
MKILAAGGLTLLLLGLLIQVPLPGNRSGIVPSRFRISGIPTTRAPMLESFSRLPLSFEPNYGQTDGRVKFLARGSGSTLFLTADEVVLALSISSRPRQTRIAGPTRLARPGGTTPSVVRIRFLGANPAPQAVGLAPLPGRANYFIGNDSTQWYTNVPTYARVRYEDIYPGIDLVFYGTARHLEYDFVVHPGGDPYRIVLDFKGVTGLEVDARGDLVLQTTAGPVLQRKPVIYQEVDGVRRHVDGGYVLQNAHRVAFQVAAYGARWPLIIDPVLAYSTYLGGGDVDFPGAIAVDAAGNAYVTGLTWSSNFPTANPLQAAHGGGCCDAYVAKLNAAGSALAYSTYLGGNGVDFPRAIAVDAAGNAYVTGRTESPNFPMVNAVQAAFRGGSGGDAYVTKLNADGSALAYSTYLGGSSRDEGTAIAVDAAGNAYVTGWIVSNDFPTANPVQAAHGGGFGDAFVTKLNAAGSGLIYSTYLGGSDSEYGEGITVDAVGSAYVTGLTASTNFPTTSPVQAAYGGGIFDAFVVKLNPSGSARVYSTYLGGSGRDGGYGITVDASGSAYVTGSTNSPNFPTASPLQAVYGGGISDAFLTKVNPAGSALAYSTYLGGSGDDWRGSLYDIAVDGAGNAYITGSTNSLNFPTTRPLQTAFGGGDSDAFVAKLNPAGSALAYSTYMGGSGRDEGLGIAVDAAGNAYVAGSTDSRNFPTTSPVQAVYGGGDLDAFVAKITDVP